MYNLPTSVQSIIDQQPDFYNKGNFDEWSAEIDGFLAAKKSNSRSMKGDDLFNSSVPNQELYKTLVNLEKTRKRLICSEINKEFSSMSECADYFNVSITTISNVLKTGTRLKNIYTLTRG